MYCPHPPRNTCTRVPLFAPHTPRVLLILMKVILPRPPALLRNIAKPVGEGHPDPSSDDVLRSSEIGSADPEVRIKPITVVADGEGELVPRQSLTDDDTSLTDDDTSLSSASQSHSEGASVSSNLTNDDTSSTNDDTSLTDESSSCQSASEQKSPGLSNSTSTRRASLSSTSTVERLEPPSQGDNGGSSPQPHPEQNPQSTDQNRGSGGKRISRAEMILRVRIVEGLMLRGFLGRDVQRGLEQQFKQTIPWNTVQKYVRHVAAMWEEEDALARPYRRQRQLRQLHDVADQLLDRKAWKEWLETQRLIARIEGNEAPLQHELSVRSKFDGWSVEELESYAASAGKTVPVRFLTNAQGSPCSQLPGESEGIGD